jgi:hypothetical protein
LASPFQIDLDPQSIYAKRGFVYIYSVARSPPAVAAMMLKHMDSQPLASVE